MSNSKFTKGDWEVKSTSIHPARIKVKDKKGNQGKIIGDIRNINDAQLIAAAPEMYGMLEILIANYQVAASAAEHEGYETCYSKDKISVESILKKARGEDE